MAQLTRIANASGLRLYFKWPYHAMVMKMFEMTSKMTVLILRSLIQTLIVYRSTHCPQFALCTLRISGSPLLCRQRTSAINVKLHEAGLRRLSSLCRKKLFLAAARPEAH